MFITEELTTLGLTGVPPPTMGLIAQAHLELTGLPLLEQVLQNYFLVCTNKADKEIYAISQLQLDALRSINQSSKTVDFVTAGIYVGKTHLDRCRLSIVWITYFLKHYPQAIAKKIILTSPGVKHFLYGRDLDESHVLSHFGEISEKQRILLFDQYDELIGIGTITQLTFQEKGTFSHILIKNIVDIGFYLRSERHESHRSRKHPHKA